MAIISPNMGLPISTVGVDTGTTWETNLVASQTILDGHNHTSGSGVQIPPAGININSAMAFNNNPAIALQASVYTAQASLATLNATYVSGVDLYYNDGNGVAIQLTSSGAVNSTSSGISSGTATASFAAGVLVVDSDSLTPANIQCASILIGNNVASSNYLTLGPPVSMPASYSIVLPSLPASTLLMTLDSAGNMGTVANTAISNTLGSAMTSASSANTIGSLMTSTAANSIGSAMTATGANAIGSVMTATGANVVANVRTRASGQSVGAGGIANDDITSYTNSTTTPSTIATVTLTTSGRPVMIVISPEIGAVAQMTVAGTAGQTLTQTLGATLALTRNSFMSPSFVSTPVQSITAQSGATLKINSYSIPSQIYLDLVAAGTWTYTLQGYMTVGSAAGTLTVAGHLMVAYEL